MKKTILLKLLLLFLIGAQTTWAQNFNCGHAQAQEALYQKHPELRQQQTEFDNYVREYIQNHYGEVSRSQQIIIPIVFHVIHDYGVENISDAQIIDQVAILNRDYNKLNADTSVVIPEFKSIIANVGIEFRLAKLDPQGNCTNGIDRIASPLTHLGNDEAKLNAWDRRKYLNVWTVKKMRDGVAGYAYKPQSVSGYNFPIDGIIILHDYIGSVGTGNAGRSRALTHEIGHWLNLSHPWGDNNSPGNACGDDGIQDTPITKGWTNCPLPQNSAVCDPLIKENYQNFMDYSYCSFMFTEGQKQAMLAALSSDVSFRDNLWSETNLTATGVLNSTATCAPKADFFGDAKFICVGTSVTYKDNSTNGIATSWSWSFPGGNPSSSTVKNPVIQYPTPGYYPVSLTATNANGTSSKTENNYVFVSPLWSDHNSNYVESFESANLGGWFMLNPSNNAKKWQQVGDVGATGSSSLMLSGFYQGQGDADELISPSYDLRYLSNLSLSFKYIGATKALTLSDMRDSLTVYVSTDCGKSWSIPRLTVKRAALIKAGQTESFYKPSSADVWSTATVNLGAIYAVANVRFKFKYTSGDLTNNFFLDDINVSGVLSVNENEMDNNKLSIYPNPMQDNATITISVENTAKVTIDVLDITGRTVETVFVGTQKDKEFNYSLNASSLSSGIYFIRANINDKQVIKKLLVY